MKKPVQLVRRAHVITMQHNADVERMLNGDYMLVREKAKTAKAAETRQLRRRRLAEGWYRADFMLDPEQIALVRSVQLPGETLAELLTRLILEHGSNNDKS